MVGKNSTKIVYFVWLVLTGWVVPEDIEGCRREIHREAALELIDTFNETGTNTTYHVYIAHAPLTWCQSYLACKGQSQRLLTIQSREIQQFLGTKLADVRNSGKAWLGSRRKDYGGGWTWVNESLTDCQQHVCWSLAARNPYSNVFTKPGNATGIISNGHTSDIYIGCTGAKGRYSASDEIAATWYDAQSTCSTSGGRLRTMDEYVSDSDSRTYWLGLFYKPWIWIGDKEHEDRPVVYFRSNLTSAREDDKACLSLNLTDMSWHAETCERPTGLVICQGDGNATNTSNVNSTNTIAVVPEKHQVLQIRDILLIAAGGSILCAVAVITRCARKRQTKKDTIARKQRKMSQKPGTLQPDICGTTRTMVLDSSITGTLPGDDVQERPCSGLMYEDLDETKLARNSLLRVGPSLPERDDTYDQAFEDTRPVFSRKISVSKGGQTMMTVNDSREVMPGMLAETQTVEYLCTSENARPTTVTNVIIHEKEQESKIYINMQEQAVAQDYLEMGAPTNVSDVIEQEG